jgi:protein-tyrosine-phosphatase
MTYRDIVLTLSEENFSRLVQLSTRKFRAELFQKTGIHKATRRIIDPVARRKAATERLHGFFELDDGRQSEVAFRLVYDMLAGKRRAMIVDFLDMQGIPHEEGLTDDLARLNELTVEELREAYGKLAEKYPACDVALYFFFTAGDRDFQTLAGRLTEMPELLGALREEPA